MSAGIVILIGVAAVFAGVLGGIGSYRRTKAAIAKAAVNEGDTAAGDLRKLALGRQAVGSLAVVSVLAVLAAASIISWIWVAIFACIGALGIAVVASVRPTRGN
jgi:hypothetical protein